MPPPRLAGWFYFLLGFSSISCHYWRCPGQPFGFSFWLFAPPPFLSIESCCLLAGSRRVYSQRCSSLVVASVSDYHCCPVAESSAKQVYQFLLSNILAKNNGTARYIYLKIFPVTTTPGLFRCSTKPRMENCPRSIHSQQRNKAVLEAILLAREFSQAKSLNLRAGKTRIQLLEEARVGGCASGSHGNWQTRSAVIRQAGDNERGNL